MKRTISLMTGAGSVRHNARYFYADNVDVDRVKYNVTYVNEDIKIAYQKADWYNSRPRQKMLPCRKVRGKLSRKNSKVVGRKQNV